MSLSRREKNVGVSRSVSGGQSEYYNNNTDDVQEVQALHYIQNSAFLYLSVHVLYICIDVCLRNDGHIHQSIS